MVRFNHGDLPTSGSSGDFFRDMAAKARDVVCDIHSNFPAVTTGIDGGINSGAVAVRKGFMDSMCAGSPAPPPPEPRALFPGGQCPTKYRIIFETRYIDPVFGLQIGSYGVNVWGAIGGVGVRGSTNNSGVEIDILTLVCRGLASSTRTEAPIKLDLITMNKGTAVEVLQVYTLDGDADNCGDPNPQYPPEYGKPLPVPFPIPGFPSPVPDAPPLPIFLPTPVFIKPDFNISIDIGGVTFNFDAGGVEFNLGNRDGCDGSQGSCNGSPGGSFPTDYANKDDVANLGGKIDGAKDAAEGAKDFAQGAKKAADDAANNDGDHPQNDPNKQDKDEKGEDDPKEDAGIERLLAVQVFLTQIPTNLRTQAGSGAPDVLYAGWFEFSTKGVPHPRHPIHFDKNYFLAPVGADGYAYTVYNGVRAKHTVITAKAT